VIHKTLKAPPTSLLPCPVFDPGQMAIIQLALQYIFSQLLAALRWVLCRVPLFTSTHNIYHHLFPDTEVSKAGPLWLNLKQQLFDGLFLVLASFLASDFPCGWRNVMFA
jgi:hypothetical protein